MDSSWANAKLLMIDADLQLICEPKYFRAHAQRNGLLIALGDDVDCVFGYNLNIPRFEEIVCRNLPFIVDAVFSRHVSYATLYKLIQILRIDKLRTLYDRLESEVLKRVRQNKYKAFWLLVALIKTKQKVDGDISNLENVVYARYFSPNKKGYIEARFLKSFIKEFDTHDKMRLFKHCLEHRECKDTYGVKMLDAFFSVCPEYEKYSILK